MSDIKTALQEFVATYNDPKVNKDLDKTLSYFPELKGFDKNALSEYIATYEDPKVKGDWEKVNSYFPEFFADNKTQKTTAPVNLDDNLKLMGVDRTPKPQAENPMWLTPELEKQAKQNEIRQDVEPLSPKEASDVIYGGIPGTTKIGDVNIAPIGKDWQKKAANIPQSVPTEAIGINAEAPQVEMQTVTFDPEQVAEENKKPGFGDFYKAYWDKLNQGASSGFAGMAQYGEMVYDNLSDLTNYKWTKPLSRLFDSYSNTYKSIGDFFKNDAEFSRDRADIYKGKDYVQLMKEGRPLAAAGQVYLEATASAPTTLEAIALTAAGAPQAALPLFYVQSAGQKYDELRDKDMNKLVKGLNIHLTGLLEAATERFGDMVAAKAIVNKFGADKVKQAATNVFEKWIAQSLEKSALLTPTVMEGASEVANSLGQQFVDLATGVDTKIDGKEILDSFVFGIVGGAQFGAIAAGKGQYDKIKAKKQAESTFNDADRRLTAMLSRNGFTAEEVQDVKNSMLQANPENRNDVVLAIAQAIPEAITRKDGKVVFNPEIGNVFTDFYIGSDKLQSVNKAYNETMEAERAETIRLEKENAAQELQRLAGPDGMIRTVKLKDGTTVQVRGESMVFDENGMFDMKNSSTMLYYTDEAGQPKMMKPYLIESLVEEKPIEQAAMEADQIIDQEISDKEIDEFLPLQPETYKDAQGTIQVQYNPETMEIEAVLVDENSGTPISDPYAIDKTTYSQMSGKPMPEAIKTTSNEPLNDGSAPVISGDMTESAPLTAESAPEAAPQYPVNKKGEVDFDAMSVAQTYQYMVDNYGEQEALEALQLQEKNTQAAISANIKATDKFKSGQYAEVKKATTIQEQLKIREKHKATAQKLTDERAVLDAQLAEIRALMPVVEQAPAQPEVKPVTSSNVRPEVQFRREQEAKAAEQAQTQPETTPIAEVDEQPVIEVREKEKKNIINPWQKRLNNLGDAMTVEDVVLRRIAGGAKFVWTANAPLKGMADELGFANKPGERELRKSMIDNENGMTPQEFAHVIYESGDLDFMPGVEYQDVYNAVLDTLLRVNSATDAMETAERLRDSREFSMNEQAEWDSMTEAEMQYLEEIPDDILESYLGITNFTPQQLDIIQNLQNEYYGTDTTTTETSAVDSTQGIESETATAGTTEGISTEQIQSETDLNPTEAQKKAGNYKKAHIAVSGMDISIENPVGSVRRGTDEDGKAWEHEMKSHYGYFIKTEGKDGDHIDTFIKEGIPTDWNGTVFAIDQINPKTGAFDETKVMIGYETPEEAKAAYMENYDADWKGFSAITPVSLEDFKTWLYDGKKQRKPYAEYKETPEAVDVSDQLPDVGKMIEKPAEATSAPKYKNGDTVYYKGKPYVINGLYNGELMYDLETEDGKEAFEEVPESELNQSELTEQSAKQPWEMTREEFSKYHNTGYIEESHYDESVNADSFGGDVSTYPELVETKNINGKTVEFRKTGEKLSYVKTRELKKGEQQGWGTDLTVRDSKGLATYLTDKEAKDKGYNLFDTTISAFVDGKRVGYAADSFGADEVMVVNALSSMADHGRAAIIIGGHTKYKENGTLASEKAFLNYLYDKYNVADIINVDGSLYSKQGTTFPVRLILINGRRTGFEALQRKYAPLQKDARSEQVSTFDELYKRVKDNENNLLRSGTSVQPDSGVRTTTTSNGATIPTGATATNRPGSSRQGESGATSTRPSQNGRPSDKPTKPTTSNDAGGSNIQPDATSGGQTVSGSTARSERRISTQDADKFLNRSNARPEPLKIDISKEKTQYPARSKSAQIGSVVPTNVAQTINDILHKFDDIDAYVQTKLGYESKDELFNALAAEQIDSVALAIYQIENGKALIIGDMTGVGKGRQASAIIRYAVMSGKRPIFITEKPQLFSDIYRDLRDIGSADLNPFILNSKGNEDPAMTDENGVVIYNTPKDAVKKQILESGKLPEEYDYTVLTYSQLNGNVEKNGPSAKQSFFRNIATDNILVMDESHNAGGEGNTGTFMTKTLPTTKGVVFLSGTFAKRADNMPIYAMKTSMNEANMSETELIEAIKTGGIPLQEIMSKNLTETGQMVRRERDFTGVTIDWQTMTDKKEQHWKTFDGVIELFNELIKFQKDYVDPVIEAMNDDVADVQGSVDARTGTRDLGISNQPFASKTFNLVRQMLFSLKAQEVADEAIKELKAGNKPVIAIGNTMETFINDIGAVGTTTDKHDYSLTLVRGLTGLFRITETDANGERIQREIDKSIIGAEGLAKYAELEAKINKLSSGISISPIDVIKSELSKAGYSVGEMTGRTNELVFNEDGTATVSKRTNTDKKKLARDFNSGNIDVLILNQSASTGISLHASNKFKDQRKRVMLFAQNQLDVNTEVQMRGRIDRTGQVQRGAYRYIISPIPAEQRMIMMFKAKLKSLDANTTSSQKSKTNEIEVVDFLNKYGDEIVIEYLKENPDINLKMLDPFNLADKSEDELSKITTEAGAASKAAGRAALLSVKEQEAFYTEITEKYNTLINYLNDAGANDLEITTLPLKAETKAKHIVIQGKNSGNPFSEDSVRETVEVDVLKKPMNIKEVNEEIQKLTEGKTAVEYRDALIAHINAYTENQVAQETKKIQDEIGKKQESFFAKAEKEADRGKLEGEARNEFMDAKRQDFDSTMQLHIDTRTNAIRNRAQTILRTVKSLPVGKVVLIPSTLEIGTDTTYSEGMFLGFRMKEKLTPSTITAAFATLDGRRRIDVPLSKVPFLQAVYSETMQNIRHIKATPENWDSMIPTRTRKTAYIITGNILQAYGRNELRGQLVSYSTVTGEIRQGILLPDKYKSDEQTMRVQVIDRINDLRNGQALADVSNGVTIRKETPISYSISVPLSKVRGGKYFLDAGLRDLVYQKDFRQMAGQMVGMVSENKIEEALRYLSDKFNISVDVAIKKVDNEALYQIGAEGTTMKPATTTEVAATVEQLLKTGLAKEVKIVSEQELLAMKDAQRHAVYHGSPHAFDKFSLSKIGTGEGQQAYGWGLYFTDKKSIAESYATELSKQNEAYYFNNKPINDFRTLLFIIRHLGDGDKIMPNTFNDAYLEAKEESDISKSPTDMYATNLLKEISENPHLFESRANRNLYTVKIHGDKTIDELNFLRWDKPVTDEQKSAFYKIAREEKLPLTQRDWSGKSDIFEDGKTLYDYLAYTNVLGSPKRASELLLKAGIDGIQYPTEYTSKGEHEESYNYVVFDENALEITEHIQFMHTPSGTIYGAVKDGIVYLNKNTPNLNTPIHEFGHLWVDAIEGSELYNRGAELVKDTPYWERVNTDPNYKDLSETARTKEAMAMAIGDKGESVVKNKGLLAKLKSWIADVWKTIGAKFGIQNLTPEQIENLTFEQFTDIAVSELLSGEKLNNAENSIFAEKNTMNKPLNYKFDNKNCSYFVRFSDHIQDDMERGWSSWQFGENGFEGTKEELLSTVNEYKENNSEFEISGFNVWIDENTNIRQENGAIYIKTDFETFEIRELYPNYWVAVDNINSKGGLSAHELPDNILDIQESLNEIKDKPSKYDGTGDGQTFNPFDGAKVIYSGKSDKNNSQQFHIIEVGENKINQDMPSTINVDGIQRPTTNSTGKPIHSTEEGIRNFWRWFGDSKVVDNEGLPLVVYHGTKSDFNEFDKGKQLIGWIGKGFYFTKNKSDAKNYGKRVINSYLKIENPFIIKTDKVNNDGTVDFAEDVPGQIKTAYKDFNAGNGDYSIILKENGHDGIIWGNMISVFEPTQIKSATGNFGSFDPSNADIRYQIIGKRGASNLDAAEEATTRLDNLAIAKEMEAATKNPAEIRLATGWERGVDGLWRYEVPDGELKENWEDAETLEQAWDDDKLFTSYPQLKNITVKINNNTGYGGSYIKETNTIEINLLKSVGKEGQKSTLIHEIQHAIQDIEGFAKGGNTESIRPEMLQYPMMIKKAQEKIDDYYQNHPDGIAIDKETDRWLEINTNPTEEEYAEFEAKMKAKYPSVNSISQYTEIIKQQRKNPKTREEAYKRLSGETEARNASARMNMSQEERRKTLLSATADVAPEDQIVLMDATGVSMSIPEKPQPPVFSGREDVLTRLKQSSQYAKELQKWQKKNIENIAAQVSESEEVNKKLSELNKSVDKWSAKLWEAWADGQKPVKKWQNFLKANGVEINDGNDYHKRFTAMPGRVEYRFTEFDKTYIEPFIETLKAFKDRGVDYDALGTYAKLKHADEYTEHVMNQKMAERGWSDNRINLYTLQQTQPADVVKKYWYDWAEKRILNLKNDNAAEYEQAVKSINEQRDRAIEEVTPDFAGKRAIEERLGMSAEQYIADIESIGKANGLTDMFWKQVKRINEFSLMEEVRSGRRTAASAEQILSTFEWYVPLKNHYDMTAEDTFDYSTERGQFFVTAVKRGKGRRSESGDPFSVMVSTVRSSIGASEENMLKQALLRLAELDNTGSTTVSKAWFKKTGEDADGKHIFEVAPTVEWSNDDTQETYNEKVRAFEMEMQELAAKGEAYRGKIPKLKIGVWIKPTNAGEHEVHVMRNGEMYVVRFNTSPRVPQAVNKVNYRYYEGFAGAIFDIISKYTRFLAATKTMFRLSFVFITNPLRDIHHGASLAYINRGAKFTAQAVAFLPIAATTLMRRAVGKINVNNKYDMALNNYMLYGAKTGISKILELKQMERSLKSRMTNTPHLWSWFKNIFQTVSEITENQMRFAVYLAALKNGDSTLKAVSMAKQATVNFDLKGNGRNGLKEISSLYAFVRVGFQAIDGLYSASTQSAETKRRFAVAATMNILGGMVLEGAINSLIYNLFKGDDDEEDGWINDFAKLSTYERNSNFLIWTPEGIAKGPLGQEFRVFHGLGMDMLMLMHGKATATETAINFGKGLTSLLPYNPIESAVQGSWGSAMPDAASMWSELAANRDWMGTRIYKENQDEDAPGYMKVRTNKRGEYYASEFMFRLSKALDKATGGDEAVKGWFSPNPDVAEHLVGGYLNGLLSQTLTVADFIINKDPKEFIPSAIWKSKDDIRQRTGGLNEVYYDVKEATEETKRRADRYEEAKDELKNEFEKGLIDPETYNSSVRRINNSLNALDKSEYYTHKGVLSTISELEVQLKANKGDKQAQQRIETSINELKEYLAGGDTLKGYYGTRAKYAAKREAADDYRKWLKKQAEQNIQVEPDEAKYTDVIMIFEGPKGKKSFNSILEDIDKELEKNPDNEELKQQAIEIMNTIINP